jgi:DNA polymerase III sliding clamp (beta) subunit (PCNA family)
MSTITITGENLIAALAAVTPSAGVDDTLPILTCVHFETRDGELFVATTDRYTLATYRVDTTEITGELRSTPTSRAATSRTWWPSPARPSASRSR